MNSTIKNELFQWYFGNTKIFSWKASKMVFFISAVNSKWMPSVEQLKFSLKNPILKTTGEKKPTEAGFSLID
nr:MULTISPECIES: hypothetical protein [Providencia]